MEPLFWSSHQQRAVQRVVSNVMSNGQVEREVPESTPTIFGGEQAEPGSPIWSLAFEAPEAGVTALELTNR